MKDSPMVGSNDAKGPEVLMSELESVRALRKLNW